MPRTAHHASRVAFVTGGGSGIGEAICRHLADAGHRVVVTDLDGDAAARVAKDIENEGGRAIGLAADVSDRAAVQAAVAEARAVFGPVQILVTSAGWILFHSLENTTPEQWDRVLDVNLTGTYHCAQEIVPDMVAQGWGRIVTISSSSAQRGSHNALAYAVAKGGVIVLTKALAREYATKGITANCIPPSGIETPMQHKEQAEGHLPSNDVLARGIPMGYLGTPDDIAAVVAFLASDDAAYITGQVLGVNGGSVM